MVLEKSQFHVDFMPREIVKRETRASSLTATSVVPNSEALSSRVVVVGSVPGSLQHPQAPSLSARVKVAAALASLIRGGSPESLCDRAGMQTPVPRQGAPSGILETVNSNRMCLRADSYPSFHPIGVHLLYRWD